MVGLRFTAAAQAAGIDRRVTAHSGRVGQASELTSRGASTTDVMLAGNWRRRGWWHTTKHVAYFTPGRELKVLINRGAAPPDGLPLSGCLA